ncbi:outer membrane lipoprotein-sorting protein [soil metagenome]
MTRPLPLAALAVLTLTASMLVAPGDLVAQDSAARGLAIARDAKQRDTGYGDFTAKAKMVLRNAQGQTTTKEMDIRVLEAAGGVGEKSLTLFTSPADTAGTVLLSHSFKTKSDDQWLYLPSIKRTKRIASGNKSGSFVGSEFSYEDISPQQVEKYTYKYIKDDTYSNQPCHVVERYPTDPKSGYTKQVIWMDTAHLRPLKVENYDRKNSLLKTLAAGGYKQYLDQYWRPTSARMINHQTGKSTDIIYSAYQFRTGLDESDFDESRLERLR